MNHLFLADISCYLETFSSSIVCSHLNKCCHTYFRLKTWNSLSKHPATGNPLAFIFQYILNFNYFYLLCCCHSKT
jgi:hypothetical protein